MYPFVSICIHMYLYMYPYVSIYVSICIHMYLHVSICIHMYPYVSTCIYMYLYVSIYESICIHMYPYVSMLPSFHLSTYLSTYLWVDHVTAIPTTCGFVPAPAPSFACWVENTNYTMIPARENNEL